jgi:hypothetical protein
MSTKGKIFISAPRRKRLEDLGDLINFDQFEEFKKKIYDKIVEIEYQPVRFGEDGVESSGTGFEKWSPERFEKKLSQCVGAVIIGIPFWKTIKIIEGKKYKTWLPSEYCQYEGAAAYMKNIPVLAIAAGIEERIVFGDLATATVISLPEPDATLIKDNEKFGNKFKSWKKKLEEHHDVFFGYSSKADGVAKKIREYLEKTLGVTVLDWNGGFAPGSTILKEVEKASKKCSTGIFLFSGDDTLVGDEKIAAPRDNVVFEAGYFLSSKGNDNVLIILEEGAKMPADLGGKIYLRFVGNKDLKIIDFTPIKDGLKIFVDNNLNLTRDQY